MRRSQYLAAISLGIVWTTVSACQRGDSDRGLDTRDLVENVKGGQATSPRFTKNFKGSLEDLERALGEGPQDVKALNNLGAKYFLRAYRDNHPIDFVRALDAAAKAHDIDPSLPEVRFNFALSLERLYLNRVALDAWRDYLSLDHDSAWAEEARRHIQALVQPDAFQHWNELLPKLKVATQRGNVAHVLQIVTISPQSAREYALETALGGWGGALEAGDREGADRWLGIASQIGEALQSLSGDLSVRSAVAAIRDAAENPSRLRKFALGHREFRDGMRAYRPLHTGEAGVHFATARDALSRVGSPIELWALCGLARIWAYEGRFDRATWAYQTILPQAERQQFLSLTGWTQWGWAWIDARQGRPMSALSRTREMEESYRKAGEAENLGAARFMVGQALFLLGQRESGWEYNYRALDSLAKLPTVFRRHVLLIGVARNAMEDGLPEAGLLIQAEALRMAREAQDPIRLSEIHAARSELLSLLSRRDEAMRELEEARVAVRKVPDDATGRKLRADLLWTEGEAWLHQQPQTALELLSRAISEYQALDASAAVAYASLNRAQAYRALEMDQQAEEDLERGLQILEDPVNHIQDEDLRFSYDDSIEEAYNDLIRLRWENTKDHQGALQALERSRNINTGFTDQRVQLDRLPEDGIVVEYAVLKDRLLIWMLGRQFFKAFETRIPVSALDVLVERYAKALQKGSDEKQAKSLGAELYRLLIPQDISGLSDDQVVYFIPDKSLNEVPFAALWNDRSGHYFIEEHSVAISSSLGQVQQARDAPPAMLGVPIQSVLLVGNPAFDRRLFQGFSDLPDAAAEVAAAARNFEVSEILDPEKANKGSVLERLNHFDAFIFAGHAVLNSRAPSQSYLLLAPSSEPPDPGLLSGSEIRKNKYRHLKLVVLSACSSIGPRATRASGLIGIARPFLLAGVPNVVGTLWSVSDADNKVLLPKFYAEIAKGMPAIRALREMQISAIQDKSAGNRARRAWPSVEIVVSR